MVKITDIESVEWDIKLETLNDDYFYQLIPVCTILLVLKDGTQKEFQFQICDKTMLVDSGSKDLPIELVNKIIDRIESSIKKEVDSLIPKVEFISKYGTFEKEFWDKFWLDNMVGK